MSLQPQDIGPVPEETARVARAAYPRGTRLLRLRDEPRVYSLCSLFLRKPSAVADPHASAHCPNGTGAGTGRTKSMQSWARALGTSRTRRELPVARIGRCHLGAPWTTTVTMAGFRFSGQPRIYMGDSAALFPG
jgi:hypothetical protein